MSDLRREVLGRILAWAESSRPRLTIERCDKRCQRDRIRRSFDGVLCGHDLSHFQRWLRKRVQPTPFGSPRSHELKSIETGEFVEVSSGRGQLEAVAFVTGTVAPGQVFIPMHYVATNELTFPAFDPWSRQPAYKSAAVKIVKSKTE